MVGLQQFVVTLIVECQNIFNLMSEMKVDPILRAYIVLPIILEMPAMYHKAMTDAKINVVFKHEYRNVHRGQDIDFS